MTTFHNLDKIGLSRFSQGPLEYFKEQMEYYTYAYLREDRTPYYVGKGIRNRAYQVSAHKTHGINVPPVERILFLKKNLTEEEALKHESYLIGVFGRKDIGTGILYNKTDGGEGSNGYVMTEDHKKVLSFRGQTHTDKTKERIASFKMGENNPAKREDVKDKIKRNHPANDPEKREEWLKKQRAAKLGKKNPKHSEFMKKNNPMKNPETISKAKASRLKTRNVLG